MYDNLFLDKGRRMTWFAQPRQTVETPVIARIQATQVAGAGAPGQPPQPESAEVVAPVMLFCRQVGARYCPHKLLVGVVVHCRGGVDLRHLN